MATIKPSDIALENVPIIPLNMPIETYWQLADLLKNADYVLASGDDTSGVVEIYQRVFAKAAPYAIQEKDRTWLHARSQRTAE